MRSWKLGRWYPGVWMGALLAVMTMACAGGEVPAPACGNGTVEDNEQCDDGNATAGDGCSATCQTEVAAACGNGSVEDGEQCDDGNTTAGDGCSATCQDEGPRCGNAVVEAGEACDEGDTDPCDGCSATCQTEGCGNGARECAEECDDGDTTAGDGCSATCTEETVACGNGIREGDEECDDDNTQSGDGCDATCHTETTGPVCGNGVIEGTEECDDSDTTAGDGCSATCTLEQGECGDGVLNLDEECDDGNATAGDGCSATCTHETAATCGDLVIASSEECDDGDTQGCDGCSPTCHIEACGNGYIECAEECDDGNGLSGDGCSATCTSEVTPGCGNGVVEAGEECDDSNTTAGDGCSATCTVEASGLCTPGRQIVCGGTDSWDTTAAGSTDDVNAYGCSTWDESGREYAYTFIAPSASNVQVKLAGMSADLDVFVVPAGAADACDPSSCPTGASGDTTATFASTPGQKYYLVVDGYRGAQGPFSITVTCGVCGDGNVDPQEECDDGNLTSGDGCSAGCVLEGCGNGVVETGEGCDDGDSTSCDGCSASCQVERCGDLRVECAEECDDGNTAASDGCSATCQFESGICLGDWELTCGGSDSYDTSFAGATDVIDYYACPALVAWKESGPEYAYSFVAPQTGQVTVTLTGMTVDLDVFVVADAGGTCASDACVAYGNTGATFAATAGRTYYVIVDGYRDASGAYGISIACAGGSCGDGVVNAGEQCDDGAHVTGDGCGATCRFEECGNTVLDPGEDCDDGNVAAGDGCSPYCFDEGNECVAEFDLRCGDHDVWNNGGAGATDQIDSYGCNSLVETGPEYTYAFASPYTCQATAALSNLTADLDLFVVSDTGDGHCYSGSNCLAFGDTSVSFTADAGARYFLVVDGYQGVTSDYTLDVACTSGTCGNATLDAGEECDGGTGCSEACELEAGSCTAKWELTCAQPDDAFSTGYFWLASHVSSYDNAACPSWNESGQEYTYSFRAPADGSYSVTVTPSAGDDLDVFVLGETGFGCAAGNCLAYDTTTATWTAEAGKTYYIVVDGFNGDQGPYTLHLGCP